MLVKHTYLRGWHLPGGGVERGETAPYAIAREMEEEGGVEATEPPTIFALYSNHANFAGDHIGLYRIGAWKPCTSRADNEIAERGFFDPANPPEGTTQATLRRLAEVFEGAPVERDLVAALAGVWPGPYVAAALNEGAFDDDEM